MFKSKELELREKIKDLEREARYQVKEHELGITKERLVQRDLRIDYEKSLAKAEEKIAEMEKRWDEGSYKQLSDILKALVVKLPTLDLKEIHTHCKEK